MHLPPEAFTLREDRARTSYSFQAGADRLAMAVSFDDEDTDDPRSTVGRVVWADVPRRVDARAHAVAAAPPAPQASYEDDEVTNVEFAVPR